MTLCMTKRTNLLSWNPTHKALTFIRLLLAAGLPLAGALTAAPLKQFDVLVADSSATIYAVNLHAGTRTVIAQHDKLGCPYDLVQDADGNLVVSDTGTLRIVRINPATQQQTVLAEGDALGSPYGLDMDRQNNIYVANASAVVRVNPQTQVTETFAVGGFLKVPLDVAVAADGNIYVADALAGVIRIDASTKEQTLIAAGGFLHNPVGITLDGNQTAFVVDASGRCVVAVDLRHGNQSLVSMAGYLATPVGIALAPGGTMLVSDPDAFDLDGGIMLIEKDGTQKPIARGSGELVNARGLAIVPALVDTPHNANPIH
jgi:streptogramin lyase